MAFVRNILLTMVFTYFSSVALADFPRPWQITLQEAATPMMEKMTNFHEILLWVIFGIAGLVLFLLVYVCYKFNKKANPVPSKTSHNTKLEIIWTLVPVLILLVLSIPSMKILYFIDKTHNADMTLKIIGHQWYWEYEYPLEQKIRFDSYLIKDQDLKPGQQRLLEVDNEIVLPINQDIKLLVTSTDVIHSWAVPSFGVKVDAVPGRVNETWIRITKPGKYYGQCSELCGVGHGFMPIAVRAVAEEDYKLWLEQAKTQFGE